MNKELFVSATPHETKVGITEDDQLAEIYLERENEYTLAGSIYKGRVTRVLPGMQSAFVDVGLERDAFLYVSDFMDLEQQDEDLDEAIPANRPVQQNEAQPRRGAETGGGGEGQFAEPGADEEDGFEAAAAEPGNTAEPSRDSRDFRGRRRRRGRRPESGGRGVSGDRGEVRGEPRGIEPRIVDSRASEPRSVDSKTSDTRSGEPRNDVRSDRGERSGRFEPRGGSSSRFQRGTSTGRTGRDYDYGPPPGYQPIILPGESISKYQRQAQSASSALSVEAAPEQPLETSILSNFPDDEPIFAVEVTEPLHEQHDHVSQPETDEETSSIAQEEPSAAAGLARQVAEFRHEAQPAAGPDDETAEYEIAHEADFAAALAPDTLAQEATKEVHHATAEHDSTEHGTAHGHVEEQEIEEEEADLAAYGEEPGDDDGFEEVEEETRAAGGELVPAAGVGETDPSPAGPAGASENGEVPEAVLEAEEREAEELELEEAQAEAEALLEAEAIGDGTVDASAEVRGPASEARLLQRTQRRGGERVPDLDRRRAGRRGQRRRFRSRENTVVPQISELLKEGTGNSGPDCQGADRQEGRAHHQPHRAAGAVPGFHADGESYRRVAQDRVRRRTAAAEAHNPERAREWRRWVHRAHCGGGRHRRGTAR